MNSSMSMERDGGMTMPDTNMRPLVWTARPSFETGSLIEAQRHLRAQEEHTLLNISQPKIFEGYCESLIRLGQIVLSMTKILSPSGYELRLRPTNNYCLNIPLSGKGWIENGAGVTELRCGQAALISPSCDVLKHWSGSGDVLTIHIPARTLEGDMSLGGMHSIAIIEGDGVATLLDLVGLICGSARDETSLLLHSSVATHMERAVLALLARLLRLPPSDRPAALPGASPALPYYVRRAERFMRANFRSQITLADLADAAGVSPRSLQYGFKQYYEVRPMVFFKRIRLEHARTLLLSVGFDKTISELAWDLGYQSASHFSRDYRAMFGEAPSSTLVGEDLAL